MVPNSTVAEAFKRKWDIINNSRHEVNSIAYRLSGFSKFRDTLLQALYGNNNIYQLVTTSYVDKLSISYKNPKAPKTCMDLV